MGAHHPAHAKVSCATQGQLLYRRVNRPPAGDRRPDRARGVSALAVHHVTVRNRAPFFLDIWLLEHDPVPRSITYLPSIDAVKRMVEANLGLTIMSRLSVEREL